MKQDHNLAVGSAMVKQISLSAARKHLLRLLEQVADGEEFVILKNGRPIAKLVPVEKSVPPDSATRQLRKSGRNLLGITYMAPDWDQDVLVEFRRDDDHSSQTGEDLKTDH